MTTGTTVDVPQQTSGAVRSHGPIAKLFHWGFIAVFAYAITKQLTDVGQLADPALLRFEIAFAALFLLLLAARYVFMRWTRPSALPDDTPAWMKRAARAGHLAMYGSLAMIAISGLMIGGLYSTGVVAGPVMGLALALHEASVAASYLFIGLHIAAALVHRLKGDGIWSSMVPVLRERHP